jgi:hypothetical protein
MTPFKMCDANITHGTQSRTQIAREVTVIEVFSDSGVLPTAAAAQINVGMPARGGILLSDS